MYHNRWGPGGAIVLKETMLKGISDTRSSLYYRPYFWHQNYTLANVSLKTPVFSANISLLNPCHVLFFQLNRIIWLKYGHIYINPVEL